MGPICPTCGYDKAPEWLDEEGRPIICADSFHVARTYWQYGDVVRVDPTKSPRVPQPDDRRWMILVAANTSASRQWTLFYLGPFGDDPSRSETKPFVSNWSSMYGFERIEEAP